MVRLHLMRDTVHLVSVRDCLPGFFVSAGGLTLAVAADGTITSLSSP